jgi:Zn-dependent protease
LFTYLFLAATYFVAVLIHELGHAVACRIVDFRVEEFVVWPFGVRRSGGGWKWFRPFATWGRALGWVRYHPLSGGHLRARSLLPVASGPLASFILCVFAVRSGGWIERLSAGAAGFVSAIAVWSLLLGMISLIPSSSRDGISTDGKLLLDLARGKADIYRIDAINSLISSCEWLRPRDWDRNFVQIALDETYLQIAGCNGLGKLFGSTPSHSGMS